MVTDAVMDADSDSVSYCHICKKYHEWLLPKIVDSIDILSSRQSKLSVIIASCHEWRTPSKLLSNLIKTNFAEKLFNTAYSVSTHSNLKFILKMVFIWAAVF